MTGAPWQIVKSDPQDQPPEHVDGLPWCVLAPQMHAFGTRKVSRFATHDEALAFVLAQPEVRRKTSAPAHVDYCQWRLVRLDSDLIRCGHGWTRHFLDRVARSADA